MIRRFLDRISIFRSRNDDIIDRFHYIVTVAVLIILAVLVSTKQYAGRPAECFVPPEFSGGWTKYANLHCGITDHYFLPEPSSSGSRPNLYKWAPLFLLLQALLFTVPAAVWKFYSSRSEINLDSMAKMASNGNNVQLDTRQGTIRILADHLDPLLSHTGTKGRRGAWRGGSVYLCCKVGYLINVIFWWILIAIILFGKFTTSYLNILPKNILCEFEVLRLGRINRYTVQCIMEICEFIEIALACLWVWYFILGILTIVSLANWRATSTGYISNMLGSEQVAAAGQGNVNRFQGYYLSNNGIFAIRMLAINSDHLVASDLVGWLWRRFCQLEKISLPRGTDVSLYDAKSPSYPGLPMGQSRKMESAPQWEGPGFDKGREAARLLPTGVEGRTDGGATYNNGQVTLYPAVSS